MRKLLLLIVLAFCIEGISLYAQVDRREYSSYSQSERDKYGDMFNKSILHVEDIQNLFGKSVEDMNLLLQQRHHDYIMDEPDNYVWALNIDQLYAFPVLYLIYHPSTQTMQYVCKDSVLIQYLTMKISDAGYRQDSEQHYVNNKFELEVGEKTFNVDDQQMGMWVVEIVDKETIERRRAENAAKLKAYNQDMTALEQVALHILDTSRVIKNEVGVLIESLLQSERTGDEYHQQRMYDKARVAYAEASDKYYKITYPAIDDASSYLNWGRKCLVDSMTYIEQKYASLTVNDLEKNYDDLTSAISEIDGYIESYALYDDFGMELGRKLKRNDCDEIERDYKQIYIERKTIEQLYDQKGFDRLKRESESKLKSFESDRELVYNKNKDLISFLHISKSQFERTYNEIGESAMTQKLSKSYDSLLLCAIRQSPTLEKANLRKSRVLKIDNRYKPLFKRNTINLDDYKYTALSDQIIDIVMSHNLPFRKEYSENGRFFRDKNAFYSAYTSQYYEQQLQRYKKAEKERREREERERKQRLAQQHQQHQQQRKQNSTTVNPPIEVFAMGLTGGMGLTLDEIKVDYHCGLYMMFPTSKKVSWGLFGNLGLRDNLYVDLGLQFFHGQYRKWQFLWGVGAGIDFGNGIMGTLRLGTRYRALVLFVDGDVLPTSDLMFSVKAGIGINIGR